VTQARPGRPRSGVRPAAEPGNPSRPAGELGPRPSGLAAGCGEPPSPSPLARRLRAAAEESDPSPTQGLSRRGSDRVRDSDSEAPSEPGPAHWPHQAVALCHSDGPAPVLSDRAARAAAEPRSRGQSAGRLAITLSRVRARSGPGTARAGGSAWAAGDRHSSRVRVTVDCHGAVTAEPGPQPQRTGLSAAALRPDSAVTARPPSTRPGGPRP
jgi:hypothetical protein